MKNIKNTTHDGMTAAIRERSQKVLERFGQVIVSGVSNVELLSMLDEVKGYWTDMYRPALISFCCEAVGAQAERVIDAGVMLALADAGISIHDDIVDKSLKKRFRRTILGIHGVDNALLVGDLLIVKAWSLIHEMIRKSDKPLVIAAFTEAYGNSCVDMCEAELLGISFRKNLETDLGTYEEVLWKVNSGIKACAQLGAIMGEGKEREIRALSEVGKNLSLMLGLRDDLKDSLNKDGYLPHRIENESVPLPLLYTAQSSRKRHSDVECIIKKISIAESDVTELLKLCIEADAFAYVCEIANREATDATSQLGFLKPSRAREILKLIVDSTLRSVLELCI
jgi:geranylgeranyl pyrophosphate synthase